MVVLGGLPYSIPLSGMVKSERSEFPKVQSRSENKRLMMIFTGCKYLQKKKEKRALVRLKSPATLIGVERRGARRFGVTFCGGHSYERATSGMRGRRWDLCVALCRDLIYLVGRTQH